MKRKTEISGENAAVSQSNGESMEKRQRLLIVNHKEWNVKTVGEFLRLNDLDSLVPVFAKEKINGSTLPLLTEKRLKEIGINTLGERLQVLQLLQPILLPDLSGRTSYIPGCKVFNDPIHGHIELHPLCISVMDTPQFQRLRYIKQLGGCYFVFPGASGNRFEHCIGVCHLAGQLVRALRSRQPELGITDVDVLCVELAGLCHDLGHGPFSHMFDGGFIPKARPGYKWKHEDASMMMFDYLIDDNNLVPVFEQYNLRERDRIFIKEQIGGSKNPLTTQNWPFQGRDLNKSFLYEIVANKRNGIDVDKWDYFARDCHQLGISNNFDHLRFIQFARVLEVEGHMQICSRDKEVGTLYDMFHARAALHRRAYQHVLKNGIEIMITEAMVKANDIIKIPGSNGRMFRMSEAIDDMEAYTKLTDAVFYQILYSTSDELEPARKILKKIEKRDLYKCVGQTTPLLDKDTGVAGRISKSDIPQIRSEIVQALSESGGACLSADDIVVHVIDLDYGMKEENPIDHVRFYMKSDPASAIRVRKDQVSQMLPETFREQHIRLYSKKTDNLSLQTITKCFTEWCVQKGHSVPKGGDVLSVELTPLKGGSPSSCPPNSPGDGDVHMSETSRALTFQET